eukprot:TRINITY_DN499_c1_g6_i2.p1 TRINITY_DN499_c1_g6~~TRINITY_DN499_c1_g6_i2.p1  ORF type:complete len:302 (-),score=72.66 TRINITY_DN499_c1_g6_i2:505-1410(-)
MAINAHTSSLQLCQRLNPHLSRNEPRQEWSCRQPGQRHQTLGNIGGLRISLQTERDTCRNCNDVLNDPWLRSRTIGEGKWYAGRGGNPVRGPVWRNSVLSREAMVVVQELKLAKGDEAVLSKVLEEKASRLLKVDLELVLNEVVRQDNCFLTTKVFDMVRQEVWYKASGEQYGKVIRCLGKARRVDDVLRLLDEMRAEATCKNPEKAFTAAVLTLTKFSMLDRALQLLEEMKAEGIVPEEALYSVLVMTAKQEEREELAERLEKEWILMKRTVEENIDPSDRLKFNLLIKSITKGKLKVSC